MSDDTAAEAADDVAEAAVEDPGPEHQIRYTAIVAESKGDVILHPSVETYLGTITAAHADGFDQLIDPTAFDLYPGAEYLEREVYDMFGIVFADHPDMSRVLMPEDWVGYPLRKDYAIGSIPVQFKAASNQR